MTSQLGFTFGISEVNLETPQDGYNFIKEMCNLIGQGIVLLLLGLRPHSLSQEMHSSHISRSHQLPQISLAYPPRRFLISNFNSQSQSHHRMTSHMSREKRHLSSARDNLLFDGYHRHRFRDEDDDDDDDDDDFNGDRDFSGRTYLLNRSNVELSNVGFTIKNATHSLDAIKDVNKINDQGDEITASSQQSPIIRSYTSIYSGGSIQHPSNRFRRFPTTREISYVYYMRPPILQAIKDVVSYKGWTQVYYVYDHPEGLANIELLTALKPSSHSTLPTQATPTRPQSVTAFEIHPIRIVTQGKCHVILRSMDARQPEGDKHVIVDVTDDQILQSIFRQFQNVGMNRLNYHYLVVGLSISQLDLSDFKYGGANVTGFSLVNGNISYSLENALLADSMTFVSKVMMKFVDGEGSMTSLNKILRMNTLERRGSKCFEKTTKQYRGAQFNNEESMKLINSMDEVTFTGSTGHVSFDKRGIRKDYKLDLMEMIVDGELENIGVWDSKKGLKITKKALPLSSSPAQKTNKTRIVTTIESKPYLMKKRQPDDPNIALEGNDRYEGFAADLTAKVADLVGFEYRIELVGDMKFGERMPDGTWNGMVGELTRKEADLAIAPLTITSIRERVIDFSKPFMSLGISIMIKKPEKQKPGVFSFMEPLSHSIWYCIVISYLGVSLVLFLVSRFSPNEWQIEEASYEGRLTFTNDFTLLNSLWFSLGAFMRRGCDVCPRSLSGRIVGSAWWFFTLIIISSYTANLAAFLTVERMLTPINGADDLAKQKEILYGTVDSGSTKEFFKTSKIPTYEKMWHFMIGEPSVFSKTTDEGVQRVRNSKGKYAFLMESTMNDYYNQRKPCNTMKVGGNLDSKGYGIGTYIGSDLRDKINVAVLQLLEQEKLQKLQKKWWYDKGECIIETDSKSGSKQSSLSLSNVAGIFYILIGGLGLSLVVASLEFLCKSHRDLKQKNSMFQKFYVTASMSSAVSGNFDKFPYEPHLPASTGGFRPLLVTSSNETYKPLSSHTLV